MLKKIILLGLFVPFSLGVSCTVDFPGNDDDDDGDNPPGYVQLDRATATMTIEGTTESDTVSVEAAIEENGQPVELQSGQEVLVNNTKLVGPNSNDAYAKSIPKAASYAVRVVEPTLGVQTTEVPAPGDFEITLPAAGAAVSLAAGFELQWSNPDAALEVTVELSQTLGTLRKKTLGPIDSDAGTLTITPADLQNFRQGAAIFIKVTRVATTTQVDGFAEGSTVEVSLTGSTSVVPAP